MKFIVRRLTPHILEAAKHFPAVVVTGPRRAGKTSLLRRAFPKAQYLLLEDPDVLQRVQSDPRGLLESLKPPVIFDEIQNAPALFSYVRTLIDAHPRRTGQWFFTGSQEAPLMQHVGESMAGRAAILQLLPLSLSETPKVSLLVGGYPEALARPAARALWFDSFLQTYLERDVRAVINIHNLATFRRFLALVASRHGQILNKTDLAAPLGVAVTTIDQWLGVLEITGQILLIPPYFENLGKRLIKSPRLYLLDSGLACHLLGIRTLAELNRSPFLGAIFEGFIASEIVKSQTNAGQRRELYFFRDQQGLEVDFLLPRGNNKLWLFETKATRTPRPEMTKPMQHLLRSLPDRNVTGYLIHRTGPKPLPFPTLSPGFHALDEHQLSALLATPASKCQ